MPTDTETTSSHARDLKNVAMFESIDVALLEPLARRVTERQLKADDPIWHEGQRATDFTFVITGRVKVVKTKPSGKEVTLGLFSDGDVVGHVAAFREIDYPGSAVAIGDTRIFQIERDDFMTAVAKHPDLMEALVESMMERNFHLVRRIDELTAKGTDKRLALLFLKLARKLGRLATLEDGSRGVFVDVDLSRSDLAELAGTRIETVIRIMSTWDDDGPVRTVDDGFLIVDLEQLEDLAPGDSALFVD
jgi:CRP/FNR family transcriptional regulator